MLCAQRPAVYASEQMWEWGHSEIRPFHLLLYSPCTDYASAYGAVQEGGQLRRIRSRPSFQTPKPARIDVSFRADGVASEDYPPITVGWPTLRIPYYALLLVPESRKADKEVPMCVHWFWKTSWKSPPRNGLGALGGAPGTRHHASTNPIRDVPTNGTNGSFPDCPWGQIHFDERLRKACFENRNETGLFGKPIIPQ